MDVNGSDAPEERSEPAPREGKADGGEQESPWKAMKQNVVKAAIERWIAKAEKASGGIGDGPEPVEIGGGTDPRDDGPVALFETGDLGEGPRREKVGYRIHVREAGLTSGISGERSESAACRG